MKRNKKIPWSTRQHDKTAFTIPKQRKDANVYHAKKTQRCLLVNHVIANVNWDHIIRLWTHSYTFRRTTSSTDVSITAIGTNQPRNQPVAARTRRLQCAGRDRSPRRPAPPPPSPPAPSAPSISHRYVRTATSCPAGWPRDGLPSLRQTSPAVTKQRAGARDNRKTRGGRYGGDAFTNKINKKTYP